MFSFLKKKNKWKWKFFFRAKYVKMIWRTDDHSKVIRHLHSRGPMTARPPPPPWRATRQLSVTSSHNHFVSQFSLFKLLIRTISINGFI